jgi:hypothetical protein
MGACNCAIIIVVYPIKMALYTTNGDYQSPPAKKTRQGNSKNTKLSATSRNARRKRYRGQGK